MKIKWTHEALERLFEIEDFISQDSPEQAGKFVDQIATPFGWELKG
jgi:plasmid stabilization system protein ParE